MIGVCPVVIRDGVVYGGLIGSDLNLNDESWFANNDIWTGVVPEK